MLHGVSDTTDIDCSLQMTFTVVCAGKGDRTLFLTVTNVFQFRMHCAEVQSCLFPCEILQLFSVVFYVVRAVHKFDSGMS
jgi:hypothetical protein